MDSAQWTQELGLTGSMAELASPLGTACARPALMEKKVMRPPKDQALNCPRCNSTNTKFCYYNNYSLTQPRYFCKTCRRYWTEGGTLRNVPVGGGSRKHKKSVSTPNVLLSPADQLPFSSQKLTLGPDFNSPSIPHFPIHHQTPKILDQGQDLNLGFHGPHDYSHGLSQFLEFPRIEGKDGIASNSPSSALSFMRNGNGPTRGMNTFFHNATDQTSGSNIVLGTGFIFEECKPSIESRGYSRSKAPVEENGNGSLMLRVGETKGDQNQEKGSNENNCNGFWNGMLGGGTW